MSALTDAIGQADPANVAALIANDFGEATETYRSALLLLGFVLFIVTFVVLASTLT